MKADKISFEFTIDEVRVILAGLGELRLKDSAALYNSIQVHCDKILNGVAKAEPFGDVESETSSETRKSRNKS